MTALLDVNVLVAIAWPQHVRHHEALGWFDANADYGWATCSLTELGFIRLSSNPKIVSSKVRPAEAIQLLRDLRSVGSHRFWIDDVQPSAEDWFPSERLTGHRQITDAHLAALAAAKGGRLVSLDQGLLALTRGLPQYGVELVDV